MTIIRQFDLEEEKKFPKKMAFLVSFALLGLVIAEIWANNTLASFGKRFEDIQVMDQSLRLENQILENKIAEVSSLNNIASKSAELGLGSPKSIQYLH